MQNKQLTESTTRHAVYLERLKSSQVATFVEFLADSEGHIRHAWASEGGGRAGGGGWRGGRDGGGGGRLALGTPADPPLGAALMGGAGRGFGGRRAIGSCGRSKSWASRRMGAVCSRVGVRASGQVVRMRVAGAGTVEPVDMPAGISRQN